MYETLQHDHYLPLQGGVSQQLYNRSHLGEGKYYGTTPGRSSETSEKEVNETSPTTKAVSIDYAMIENHSCISQLRSTQQSPHCKSMRSAQQHKLYQPAAQQQPPPCCCWTFWPGVIVVDLPVPVAVVVEPMLEAALSATIGRRTGLGQRTDP